LPLPFLALAPGPWPLASVEMQSPSELGRGGNVTPPAPG
jgi:hypothetical protein